MTTTGRVFRSPESLGLLLLSAAVLFNAISAAPELRINRVPLNDVVFHLAASERLETSVERGEPFLDPWVSEWSLGYPVWRSYQPLPHLVAAVAIRMFRSVAEPASTFSALFYLLIVAFPMSVYVGARLLGLSPPAAGLASLLVFAPSATGLPGSFGLGYGSLTWRGSGLYTQLFALHFLAIGLGATARALDDGRWNTRMWAALLLALTSLSHIVFGYAAFVSAAILAVLGPRARWPVRIVRLVTIVGPALVLMSWFLIPLWQARDIVNHSRLEVPEKWDSFGAQFILSELLSGRWLDFGRFPALSLVIAAGALVAILIGRRDPRAQRLLGLSAVWLVLFFGRETWGRLTILAGVPADLHLHRLQAVFEITAILLGSFGVVEAVGWMAARQRWAAAACSVLLGAAILLIGFDRASYLSQNAQWGDENLAAYEKDRPDLDAALADVRAIVSEKPGRVSAGLAATWGGQFKVGAVPIYAFLTRDHFDEASFLYHAMSKTSDVMVVRDENNRGHDMVFGVRAVVAPSDRPMPGHMARRSLHGRFAVYESSPEGYFGIVDLAAHYVGPPATRDEPSTAWLKSSLQPWGVTVSLDPRSDVGPALKRWDPIPAVTPEQMTVRGRVISETKVGEVYSARLDVIRPAYAFIKITWSPDLTATVDGVPAPVIHVAPGFGAVPVPAGSHDVTVTYSPGPLKAVLFFLGAGAFIVGWFFVRHVDDEAMEASAAARLAAVAERFATPAHRVAGTLILLGVVALHPLFRGKLIAGHDATSYPPRVVEMSRALGDGHFPPIWAPDLSSGHGQPLFAFSPPFPYWIALPFRAAGLGLTDSIQFSLALLFLCGAAAMYGIGRRLQAPRFAAVGGAVAWLFGPYVGLDLFVRAAFSEATAIALAPIALLALLNAVDRPSAWRIMIGAGALCMIQLSHNMAALWLVPAFCVIVLVQGIGAFRRPGSSVPLTRLARLEPFAAGVAVLVGAMGLAAYFWIPALLEIPYLHAARMGQGPFNWQEHILSPLQLLWSPWAYGYSVAGPGDGMSFSLGPLHLVLGLAGAVVAWRTRTHGGRAQALTFALLAAAGALLTTDWTRWIWSHVYVLQLTQFPWRALMVPGLFLPLLAVFAFERVGVRWTVALLALLVLLNLPHTEPKGYLTYDDEYYAPESLAAKGINTGTEEEFEPRWVDTRPPYSSDALTGVEAPIQVTAILRRAGREDFSVNAPSALTAESSTFYYPGWEARVDGTPAPITPTPVRGTMQFAVPPGQHVVSLELRSTPLRHKASVISIATLLVLAAAIGAERRHRAPRRRSS